MDTAALREYLGIVVDLEKNIYYQEQMEEELSYRAQTLAVPQKFRKPAEQVFEKNSYAAKLKSLLCLTGILMLFLAAANLFEYSGFIALFAIPGVIGGLLLVTSPIWIIVLLICTSAQNEENRKKSEKYKEELEYYTTSISADKERLQKELSEKTLLEAEISTLKERIEQSKEVLRSVYSNDIIFPKYRNLVMVMSIYEYLCAGRCTTLDGHEGAYNILETEIRLDRIIVQLDRVVENLEMIQQNQFMLYSAVQESNARMERLLASTDQMTERLQAMQSQNALQGEALTAQIKELQKSSELTAYHAERTQKELAYMNRMDYLTGRNDGPFHNVPPT